MSNVIINTPYAVSTKRDGSMKKSDGTVDVENIKKFLGSKKLPADVVCMEQVHGNNVAVVSNTAKEIIGSVDGLVTNLKGISLGVVTADCLPVLFFDKEENIIGIAHAGSKGLLRGILQRTMYVFKKEFLVDPKDLFVIIGPSIETDCYEVNTELVESFQKQYTWFDKSFYKPSKVGHVFLDLRKIALYCLKKEGILEEHISITNICTKHARSTYYSYRAGDKTDRFVSVISLV